MSNSNSFSNFVFVLGGDDGEMAVIRQILHMVGIRHVQPKKDWGDHEYSPSDLGLEVEEFESQRQGYPNGRVARIKDGPTVVFIECRPKDWLKDSNPVVVDHHGDRSGEPASILQVLSILEGARKASIQAQEWAKDAVRRYDMDVVSPLFSESTRRWVELVAANDAGYIPAMLALGATSEEVARVRALDRSAQGVTPAHEKEAERAIASAEVSGRLTVVRMDHSKTATVCDRLYGRYDQLLILSKDGEVNFYGDGALCAVLKEKFTGWNGGSGLGQEGQNAFWGGHPPQEEVEKFVREQLSAVS